MDWGDDDLGGQVEDHSFETRPAFTIDWMRPYDCGPSDQHLHAIGQFVANYSMVESLLAVLFASAMGKHVEETRKLCVETNMSISGMIRYTKSRLAEVTGVNQVAASDLIFSIEAFEKISPTRHRIVHWQWGLNEGEDATLADLIKPRSPEKANAELSLEDLRDHCSALMKIFQSLALGHEVLSGRKTRDQILAIREGTSAEKLFRP